MIWGGGAERLGSRAVQCCNIGAGTKTNIVSGGGGGFLIIVKYIPLRPLWCNCCFVFFFFLFLGSKKIRLNQTIL